MKLPNNRHIHSDSRAFRRRYVEALAAVIDSNLLAGAERVHIVATFEGGEMVTTTYEPPPNAFDDVIDISGDDDGDPDDPVKN